MEKLELDTPCLVIDKDKLLTNMKHMQAEVAACKKNLRPHIKTHKCTKLARLQIEHGAIGVSAAKVGEAEALAATNIPGILITSPVVTPEKIRRLVNCLKVAPDLMVVIDSKENARALNDAVVQQNLLLNVLVDIDPGVGRTGVAYDDAIQLVEHIAGLDHLVFQGIQCYAGNLQHITDYQERRSASQAVILKAAKVVNELSHKNIPCSIVSGSGTGTYDIDMEIAELTEVQPGSYTVMDMEYHLIGSRENAEKLERFQPAMTMLVTVISANHDTHVTVDAGTKSLYVDANTKPQIISHPGLHYDWSVFGDEHGKVTADEGVALPKVGDVLEIIVPHCDPTINLFDQFHIVKNGKVIDTWEIDMRGKTT